MNTKTRYFVIASLLVMTVGVGTGLVAYYVGFPIGATQGGPDELRLVPPDATLVAYADVRAVMLSEVRQHLLQLLPTQGNGQQEFQNQTGINIESDVEKIVACLAPTPANGISGMVIARGRFNAVTIESLMRDHGAHVEDYKGKRLVVADVAPGAAGATSMSVAFLETSLVAVGSTSLIRSAVDLSSGGANVTTNDEIMGMVRTFDSDNAWALGRFDTLASQAKLPPAVSTQLPPITWFSVSGHVNSGLSGTFRADTRDDEAATSLRDVMRGVVALGKLQTTAHPELRTMVDTIQLGGTGKTVTLSFDVSPQMFDLLASVVKGLPASRPETAR